MLNVSNHKFLQEDYMPIIGEGHFGKVVKFWDNEASKFYAIKIIKMEGE